MSTFEFVAFNPSGKKQVGTVKARSLGEAKRKIQKGGFYIASIKVRGGSVSDSQNSFSFFHELKELFFSKKVSV
ncbi:MAG TPA: hypothetical protein VHT73_01760 [Thermodesulfobacteriota bacterium]|nr:hypothetical protein [Thermodesulfobacteriota bacterium]